MKTLVSTLFLLFISTITFGQTKVFTEEYIGENEYKGLRYTYTATIQYKLVKEGKDIKIRVGARGFTIKRISENDGGYHPEIINNYLPIRNETKQFDFEANFAIQYGVRNENKLRNCRILGLREGDLLDAYYLTEEQNKEVVRWQGLKKNPERFKELKLGIYNIELIPNGLPTLDKIARLLKSTNKIDKKFFDLQSEIHWDDHYFNNFPNKINKQISNVKEMLRLERIYPEEIRSLRKKWDVDEDYNEVLRLLLLKNNSKEKIKSIKKSEKPKTKPKKRAKPKKKFNQNEYNATQRYRVSLLLPKYKNTYNYKEKRILLNELRGLTSYMSASDRKRIEKDVRKNNRDRTIEKISKSLVDIDYGRGERRFLIYLASGFTAISGKNDDQSAVGIPIKAGLEITFPVARKLTIDLIGEYNTHFFPDFSFLVADEVDNSYLDGIDISQLDIPEVTETTNLTRYTYGVGFTLGRKRLVTLSVLSQNIKYQYLKTEEQQTDIIIGENINIPTFGFGFTYNRHGKDKQDLGKISVSYTTNDKNLSFLNTEFENNKYSNLNVNAQTGLGALFIGFEYNLFMDGVNEANNVTSWGIKLGIKFGG